MLRRPCFLLLVCLVHSGSGLARDCHETSEWREMETRTVNLVGADGGERKLAVKVAANGRHRAAGFQHICPEVIAREAVLFLFGSEVQPTFHMRNVYAALDIAFIDSSGVIRDIQRMQPYVLGKRQPKYYRPATAAFAALEVRGGYFDEHGIEVGRWSVDWRPAAD